ncbi:hypothetical protein GCM10022223_18100 [Kineosporia mesophila]|uniref:DUF6286 domain-containing protein n=1 Tax=Kineosporia mesophila TaxID=566012 RepID=A0ABP6Z9Y7_9ACTN|nr:DUF6286 domain-containing protein [Kineosporia mesophila]MCD5351953.1 alkaline shock response membrane anchor protein AmaP [Kineosporia mesophila]
MSAPAPEQPAGSGVPVVPSSGPPVRWPDQQAPVMPQAKTPIGAGRITVVGIALAALTGALGVIGVHDGLASGGIIDGRSWIDSGIDTFDGLKPSWWAVPVGVAMVLAGLWLLTVAVLRRPRTAVALTSRTGVFLRPADVRKLAARAADDVDGVTSAQVSSSRRAAKVTVVVTGDDGRIGQDVQDAVAERLAALQSPPRLTVKTRTGVAP